MSSCSFKIPVYKYVDEKGSAAMLAIKRSSGVVPEMNLRNPLHAGDTAQQWEINPGFETEGICDQKSKTGVSVAPQKDFVSNNFFSKNVPVQR